MFGGRLGLDLTYYNANTTNQILSITTPISTGYTDRYINAGKMKSYGWEVSLSGTPIQTKDWTWNVTLNWGLNRTKCIELDESLKRYTIGTTRIGRVVVYEGEKYVILSERLTDVMNRDVCWLAITAFLPGFR